MFGYVGQEFMPKTSEGGAENYSRDIGNATGYKKRSENSHEVAKGLVGLTALDLYTLANPNPDAAWGIRQRERESEEGGYP